MCGKYRRISDTELGLYGRACSSFRLPVNEKRFLFILYPALNDGTDECSSGTTSTSCETTHLLSRRLDVVQSYVVLDEDDDSSDDYDDVRGIPDGAELPKRAYSVGSKPLSTSHAVVGKSAAVVEQSPDASAAAGEEGGRGPCVAADSAANDRRVRTRSSGDMENTTTLVTGSCVQRQDTGPRRSIAIASPAARECTSGARTIVGWEQSEMRPRTSTFPWELLRSRTCFADADPLRPRSASNGNAAQIRDRIEAVKRRMRTVNGFSLTGRADCHHASEPRIMAALRQDSSDMCEYVEMGRTDADYVDMSFGKSARGVSQQKR